MEHEFFGRKNTFGIEIEVHNWEKQVGKARFWIQGKTLGEFKVKHRLNYLVKGLNELLQNEDFLWDEDFLPRRVSSELNKASIQRKLRGTRR